MNRTLTWALLLGVAASAVCLGQADTNPPVDAPKPQPAGAMRIGTFSKAKVYNASNHFAEFNRRVELWQKQLDGLTNAEQRAAIHQEYRQARADLKPGFEKDLAAALEDVCKANRVQVAMQGVVEVAWKTGPVETVDLTDDLLAAVNKAHPMPEQLQAPAKLPDEPAGPASKQPSPGAAPVAEPLD